MNRLAAIVIVMLAVFSGAAPHALGKVCVPEKLASGVFLPSLELHVWPDAPPAPVSQWFDDYEPLFLASGRSIGMNWFAYANGDPIMRIDPSGNVVETVWDVANLGMGAASLGSNLWDGNYGWAALDAVGLVYDGFATAVPFLPAGASAGFKAARAGNTVVNSIQVGSDVARIADRTHDAARAMDAAQMTRQQAANAGTQLHNTLHSTADNLSDSFVSGFAGRNRAAGMPDMNWSNATGVWGDVTTSTAGSWAAHQRRYGNLGEGIPILYQRGVGVTNLTRLSTGAGVGLTLLQQGSNYMGRK